MNKEKFWIDQEDKKQEPGLRADHGKTRYDLIPWDALEEVAKTYTMGAEKYDDHNWRKGMSWSRVYAPILRHLVSFWRGETYDKESGLHHLAHASWGCLTLINYSTTRPEFDDRVKDMGEEEEKKK